MFGFKVKEAQKFEDLDIGVWYMCELIPMVPMLKLVDGYVVVHPGKALNTGFHLATSMKDHNVVEIEKLARRLDKIANDCKDVGLMIFAGGSLTIRHGADYSCSNIVAHGLSSNCDGGDGGDEINDKAESGGRYHGSSFREGL